MLSRWRQCNEKKIENINLAADEKIDIPVQTEHKLHEHSSGL